MDDTVLVGEGRQCIENLRPLAYSFLAELVHHMKAELTLPQIRRAIYIFSRNMQDNTLPLSTHMTCARLMHHLVESIFRMRANSTQSEEVRAFLVRILYATVAKFRTLRASIPALVETANDLEKAIKAKAAKVNREEKPSEPKSAVVTEKSDVEMKDAEDKKDEPVEEDVPLPSHERLKSLSDSKAIIKTLTIGMKTLLWSITNFNGTTDASKLALSQYELKNGVLV